MDEFVECYRSYDLATGKRVVTSSTQSLATCIINAGEIIGALTTFWMQ